MRHFFTSLFDGTGTKALLAALAATGTAAYTAQADGVITGTELGELVGIFAVGVGLTWLVPFAKHVKAITGTAVALLGAVAVAIENGGGIDGNEWYGLIGVVAAAWALYSSPNAPESIPAVKPV